MKRTIAVLTVVFTFLTIAFAAATLPPSLVLSVSGSGTANADEKRAMNFIIDAYNAAQLAANTNFVALTKTNAVDRRASYLTILSVRINQEHAADVVKYGSASSAASIISGDDLDIIMRSVVERFQNGETIQQIEADVAPGSPSP